LLVALQLRERRILPSTLFELASPCLRDFPVWRVEADLVDESFIILEDDRREEKVFAGESFIPLGILLFVLDPRRR
jgi:hypothetical protein